MTISLSGRAIGVETAVSSLFPVGTGLMPSGTEALRRRDAARPSTAQSALCVPGVVSGSEATSLRPDRPASAGVCLAIADGLRAPAGGGGTDP